MSEARRSSRAVRVGRVDWKKAYPARKHCHTTEGTTHNFVCIQRSLPSPAAQKEFSERLERQERESELAMPSALVRLLHKHLVEPPHCRKRRLVESMEDELAFEDPIRGQGLDGVVEEDEGGMEEEHSLRRVGMGVCSRESVEEMKVKLGPVERVVDASDVGERESETGYEERLLVVQVVKQDSADGLLDRRR